ncbi:MAG: sigma-70 family RNA polymerase sigma factor [Bacteroidales bacterium]|nr:sigma-70 family RNA polymerase sigma factor [Bacteroidales bacterium]
MTKSFWTRQYQKHINEMIGVCYRYVANRETAEDLAHNAFLKAIEKADTFKGTGSFHQWLIRITVNTVLMYMRENERKNLKDGQLRVEEMADTLTDSEDMDGEGMMEAIRSAHFTQEEILEAISELPEHHRTVLNLYIFDHYSHKEIAALQGISVNTSKSHLLRARKKLQQILFNKSKDKKRPLMTWFFLFPSAYFAFDRYCRRQIQGYSIAPTHPLPDTDMKAAAQQALPRRLRLHNMRVPIMASLGTVAIGAALFTALPHSPNASTPTEQPPSPTTATTDSLSTSDPTSIVSPLEAETPQAPPATPAHSPSESEAPEPEEILAADSLQPSESPAPVVVKKVVRKHQQTVIIQDTNKR